MVHCLFNPEMDCIYEGLVHSKRKLYFIFALSNIGLFFVAKFVDLALAYISSRENETVSELGAA